jgi:hypothetical protein
MGMALAGIALIAGIFIGVLISTRNKSISKPNEKGIDPPTRDVAQEVLSALMRFRTDGPVRYGEGFYLTPNIPEQLETNARSQCNVSDAEAAISLIDNTTWGSCKDCIFFTDKHVYIRLPVEVSGRNVFAIPYSTYASAYIGIIKGSLFYTDELVLEAKGMPSFKLQPKGSVTNRKIREFHRMLEAVQLAIL